MTVSRKAAQRINDIIVCHLFPGQPISNIPCASVADTDAIFPHKQMQVIFTENRDKAARILNGQQATILGYENNTIILSLPEGQPVFAYPVTHMDNDQHITHYPFNPAYAQTITKSQGRNIRHLIIWLDSDLVPGTGYVGLSRVRTRSSISFLQPIRAHQLKPVQLYHLFPSRRHATALSSQRCPFATSIHTTIICHIGEPYLCFSTVTSTIHTSDESPASENASQRNQPLGSAVRELLLKPHRYLYLFFLSFPLSFDSGSATSSL